MLGSLQQFIWNWTAKRNLKRNCFPIHNSKFYEQAERIRVNNSWFTEFGTALLLTFHPPSCTCELWDGERRLLILLLQSLLAREDATRERWHDSDSLQWQFRFHRVFWRNWIPNWNQRNRKRNLKRIVFQFPIPQFTTGRRNRDSRFLYLRNRATHPPTTSRGEAHCPPLLILRCWGRSTH